MSDDSDLKGLVVVVIALILGVLMLGTVWSNSQPPLVPRTVYGSEVLRPIEDVGGEWGEWIPEGCTDHYDCVDDTNPDGNSTYLWTVDQADEDQHFLQNLSTLDMTIISVSVWMWARVNETPGPTDGLIFGLSYPHGFGYGDCIPNGLQLLTLAWTNYSREYPNCNVGIPWTPAYLDNTTFRILGATVAPHNASVSSEGVIVDYSQVVWVPDSSPAWDLMGLLPIIFVAILILVAWVWWSSSEE